VWVALEAGRLRHRQGFRHRSQVQTEEFISGKGLVTKWECLRRSNHWLDALYNACAAGHLCGVRLLGGEPVAPQPVRPRGDLEAERHRESFVDMQRWNEMTTRWGM